MNFKIISAADIPLAEQAATANRAFGNYIAGWTEMNVAALARFLQLQGADLHYSRFVETPDGLAGFGYINRTGNVLRLGGMALIESARGTGAAGFLLEHLLEEASARGDATMMLEVIEQNPRALSLYRRHGFRQISRLLGWRRPASANSKPKMSSTLAQVAILSALEMPNARIYPDIPWPISRHAIARVEKTQAFVRQNCCVIIGDPDAPAIRVHGLLSNPHDSIDLRAVLSELLARYSEKEFFAPPVWPEEFGREIFEPLGFTPEPLTQFLMRRDL